MAYAPDKKQAAEICGKLLAAAKVPENDPEGRTLCLGVTMFVGLFLSAFKTIEDQQSFMEAAMGYSLLEEEIEQLIAQAKPGRVP